MDQDVKRAPHFFDAGKQIGDVTITGDITRLHKGGAEAGCQRAHALFEGFTDKGKAELSSFGM